MALGWVAIHRQITDSALWTDRPFSRGQAWIDLILMASHQDRKILILGREVEIKRGGMITSEVKLSEKWGWSRAKVKKFLTYLKENDMITTETSTKWTVVNIVNYSLYQDLEDSKKAGEKQQMCSKKSSKEQIKNCSTAANEQQQCSTNTAKEHQKDAYNNINNYNNENHEDKENNENKHISEVPTEKSPAEKVNDESDQEKPNKTIMYMEYLQEFEEFWKHYPRKTGKEKAYEFFCSRLREGVNPQDIIKSSKNYSKYCEENRITKRYIKLPANFLGQDMLFEEYIDYTSEDNNISSFWKGREFIV
jgi:hypothetical protein